MCYKTGQVYLLPTHFLLPEKPASHFCDLLPNSYRCILGTSQGVKVHRHERNTQ